ncbi:DUF3696 domain-containing protein [bacterium AH-315-M05]|nr:DUF3696 domain-containing protein [bacterium AH-315-M05]
MISSIRIENFKCFEDTGDIELAPITIFVGENNSGKSAILSGIHLLGLTQQSEDPGISLRLVHGGYDYGTFKDLVYNHKEKNIIKFTFNLIVKIPNLRGNRARTSNSSISYSYAYLPKRKEIYIKEFCWFDNGLEKVRITQNKYSKSNKVLFTAYQEDTQLISKIIIRSGIIFKPKQIAYPLYNILQRKVGEEKASNILNDLWYYNTLMESFTDYLKNIHHIGPLRDSLDRTYTYTGEMARKIGIKGEQALQIYSTLRKRGKKKDKEQIDFINKALYKLGFIRDLNVKNLSTRHYEFWAMHKQSLLSANLKDTGFGASQVFPILISLFTSKPGSVLIYEQPEIHLHPAAQAELGSIFSKASSKDKKIVIETHSENLILRLQTEVAKGKLKPEDVIIYYVQAKKSKHDVIKISLNKKGEFDKKWPKGFFDENYLESMKLFQARN